jgi:hypothetical protein
MTPQKQKQKTRANGKSNPHLLKTADVGHLQGKGKGKGKLGR